MLQQSAYQTTYFIDMARLVSKRNNITTIKRFKDGGNAEPETPLYNKMVSAPWWWSLVPLANQFVTTSKLIDRARTAYAPVRQVAQSLGTREAPEVQGTGDFSANYMAQIYNLAATHLDELRELGKLPSTSGKIYPFALNPSTYKIYNKGRGKKATYASFTMPNFLEAATGGSNAAEFTNGGMSGRIMVHPKDQSRYLIELTDKSAWDLDGGYPTGSVIRDFMGKYGTKGSDPNAVRQKFYLSIPVDYKVTPGILQQQDYQQINQDEAEKIFNNYSN